MNLWQLDALVTFAVLMGLDPHTLKMPDIARLLEAL